MNSKRHEQREKCRPERGKARVELKEEKGNAKGSISSRVSCPQEQTEVRDGENMSKKAWTTCKEGKGEGALSRGISDNQEWGGAGAKEKGHRRVLLSS